MLYVTTRDQKDAYTVHKTMLSDVAPDGGMFVPFQTPCYTDDELLKLKEQSFSETVSDFLNRFFSARLNGWTVDISVGRNCVKTVAVSQKIVIVEPWHNPGHSYQYIQNHLYQLLSNSEDISKLPTSWVKIAVRCAILFGAYGGMLAGETLHFGETFDVAVNVDDFTDPIAVWYGKQMGLPINMILCSSADSDGLWDLVHRGQISLNNVSDQLKSGIEHLIYSFFGAAEATRFVNQCINKKLYTTDPETKRQLSDTYFCAVVGVSRAATVSGSLMRTDNYAICADAALIYGAIQDYRAKTGENRLTLLFADEESV